jgi:hypothetical protein
MSSSEEPSSQSSGPKPKPNKEQPEADNSAFWNAISNFGIQGLLNFILSRRKSTVRWKVTGAIGVFFSAGAALYYNNPHTPLSVVISMLVIGGVFFAFAARQIALNYNKIILANLWWWIVFFAYCLLAWGILWIKYQALIWKPPELPEGCKTVFVTFGGNTASSPLTRSGGLFQIGASGTTEFVKHNRLYVNANVTLDGTFTYKIDALTFHGNMPPEWDRNFSSNAFEIVDRDHRPIFQEVYKTPEHVLIEGIFPIGNGRICATFEGYGMLTGPDTEGILQQIRSRKAIFEYPSYAHQGQYAGTNPLELDAQELNPMHITERKRDMFIGSLRKAPKFPVWILCTNVASASSPFTQQIRRLLDDSGYVVTEHPFPANINGISNKGIFNTEHANITVPDNSLILILGGQGKGDHQPRDTSRVDDAFGLEGEFNEIGVKASVAFANMDPSNVVVFIPDKR